MLTTQAAVRRPAPNVDNFNGDWALSTLMLTRLICDFQLPCKERLIPYRPHGTLAGADPAPIRSIGIMVCK